MTKFDRLIEYVETTADEELKWLAMQAKAELSRKADKPYICGHPKTPRNTYLNMSDGVIYLRCKTCQLNANNGWRKAVALPLD